MMAVIAQIILDPVRKQQTRVWRHVILHINGLLDTTPMASACFKKEKKNLLSRDGDGLQSTFEKNVY